MQSINKNQFFVLWPPKPYEHPVREKQKKRNLIKKKRKEKWKQKKRKFWYLIFIYSRDWNFKKTKLSCKTRIKR